MNTQTRKSMRKSAPANIASNSWSAQNAEGHKRADAVLSTMLEGAPALILERTIARLLEDNTPLGVMIGFYQRIGEAAKRGAYLQ
ncbi:MAG: hypothetical protein JO056_00880 [Alphaproteobacteria bacterium]|nr:hypothetical protein [Alphaproteobacteria bacterium]